MEKASLKQKQEKDSGTSDTSEYTPHAKMNNLTGSACHTMQRQIPPAQHIQLTRRTQADLHWALAERDIGLVGDDKQRGSSSLPKRTTLYTQRLQADLNPPPLSQPKVNHLWSLPES